MPVQPTMKQIAVAKDQAANPGKPLKYSMLDAGYAPNTADNPDHLTESAGWKRLMEQYFPDDALAKVHKEGLGATRPSNAAILVQQDGQVMKAEEQGLIEVPDYAVRHKYLETAYKLKGKLTPDTQINQQFNTQEMTIEFT